MVNEMNRFETAFHVYETTSNDTGDGHCGGGSTLLYTSNLRKHLAIFLKKYNITSILDLPCGDLNWMKEIDLSGIDYIGADIVSSLIERNKRVFPERKFIRLDVTEDPLPKTDLLFCRDCLFHFFEVDKIKVLTNFVNSDIKYLLTTSYPLCPANKDVSHTGSFKEINWRLPPFNFEPPIDWVDDSGQEIGQFTTRIMVLYSREQIRVALEKMKYMNMETKIQTFKDKQFQIVRGTTHPDYSYGTFEGEEHDFRDKYWNVKEGDVVLDIGASYGSYALTACVMGATVYAFEPEKTVFVDLVNNININGWQNKCFAYNIGLWNESASVDMKSYAPHWPAYTISADFNMAALDDIVQDNMTKIDWIKMDIEGAEENAIKGALKIIKKFHPKLIIECHTFLDPEIPNKLKTLVSSVYDYEFEEINHASPPSLCKILLATPKTTATIKAVVPEPAASISKTKPYISIVLATYRIGGFDVLFDSLEKQTFKDFEVIIVDGLYKYRRDIVNKNAKQFNFRYKHIPPLQNVFPIQAYCHAMNSAITRCSGDIILFTSDFRYFMPNDLQLRANFHRSNPDNHGYSGRTILVQPKHVKTNLTAYGNNVTQYVSDLQCGKLQSHMWSIGEVNFNDDPSALPLHDTTHIGGDPKTNLQSGIVNPDMVFLQADSISRKIVLAANGLNEELDGSHIYQDAEFTNRLHNLFDVKWMYDSSNPSYRIAGAHYIIKRLVHTRPFDSNKPIWQKYKNGSKDPVNNWSLAKIHAGNQLAS